MPEISTAGIFQVAFIARQMEQTPRAFFQTTFEPISVGRVPQGTHAVGWGCRENGERVRAFRTHPTCGLRLAKQISEVTMLIEQAFFNLPEIMVGNGYIETEYEGGIVSAFSLALLQELNGRNIDNPISCINAEKRYDASYNYRSDLYINLTKTDLNNQYLRRYGFRQSNYLEAKFFRGTQSNTTDNVLKILLDLYRVMLMPIKDEKTPTNIGRYFLHVYLGNPDDFFGKKFSWLSIITKQGIQCIKVKLSEEISAFNIFPQNFHAEIIVNNLCIQSSPSTEGKNYTFILSRLDEFKVTDINDKSTYGVDNNGKISLQCDSEKWIKYFVEKTKPLSDKQAIYNMLLDRLPINELLDVDKIKNSRLEVASSRGKKLTNQSVIDEIVSFLESKSEEHLITELISELIHKYDKGAVQEKFIDYLVTKTNELTCQNPKSHSAFKKQLKSTLSELFKNLFK